MPNKNLQVVVRMTARPEKVSDVLALLRALIAPSRKEQGCLSYHLLHNANDPTDFTAVEEWTDAVAYQGHLSSPHVQAALAKFGALTKGPPDIQHYSQVSG